MKVYQAINAVSAGIGHISKNRDAGKLGYKFRGIDQVMNALQHELIENQLVIAPRVKSKDIAERESKSGGAMIHVVIEVEYDFISAEDGSTHVVGPFLGEAMDSGDKACNKAMATAYKYMAFQTFCIPTEEQKDTDDDPPPDLGKKQAAPPPNKLIEARALYGSLMEEANKIGVNVVVPQNQWSIEQFASNGKALRARIEDAKAGQ